jgi:hypothetical protein
MSEPLTPEQARAKAIAELMAMPGPKPLKPIPPEILAETLEDQIPYDQAVQEYKELMEKGGYSFDEVLAAFDRGAGRAE